MKTRRRALIVTVFLLILTGSVLSSDPGWADKDHHRSRKHFSQGKDHGNEGTGLAAAWILGAANFTVALSLLIKGSNRLLPLKAQNMEQLARFNRFQKKHLMKLHFFLNPLGVGIAFSHWILSHCRSTSLPEWGLICMSIFVGLGVMIKFKLSPKSLRKGIYNLHTHPVFPIVALSILLVGHSMVD